MYPTLSCGFHFIDYICNACTQVSYVVQLSSNCTLLNQALYLKGAGCGLHFCNKMQTDGHIYGPIYESVYLNECARA